MKQYLDLLENILNNGVEKESGRVNMPNTIGISHGVIKMNLHDGFPLLTTKKMFWKGIVHELLWFLRGDTNIKYLVDNNVNIWNDDAYRWYLKYRDANPPIMKDGKEINNFDKIGHFIEVIKSGIGIAHLDVRGQDWFPNYRLGDLGKVYGYQWRNQNGVDQIKKIVDGLKSNPYSRYHVLNTWNAADFKEMALPPCHLLYQFIVRPLTIWEREKIAIKINLPSIEDYIKLVGKEEGRQYEIRILDENNIPKFYLDLNMYQRSVDTFLGCPFNLASMSCLLHIFAKASNMIAGVATWIGGDTHIYIDHRPMVKEQLKRIPYQLPELIINKELNNLDDILQLTIDDFELVRYESHDAIKAELFTGLKKK